MNKLQPCPDCGNQVSLSATSCPHCGRPLQMPKQSATGLLAAIIIALIIGGILYFLIAG